MSAAPVDDGDDDGASPFAIEMPRCPYPGLRPFEMAEWPIFFGRERMVDAVVSRVVSRHFVAVHGDSGSGKSSLIRAGVLPRLLQDQARSGARWRTCIAQPGDGPLRNLARALARLDGREEDTEHLLALRRALNQCQRAPAALASLLLQGGNDHLCILIDQFEELFEAARRPGAEAECRLLADALVALAAQPTPGLYVALTMRSEFLGACARFPGLAEAINAHQYLLPPMVADDLLRAIREPAQLYGGQVEPSLAERLAQDAQGPDGLPLVQHALMLMHQEAGAGTAGWQLSMAQYPAEGLAALLSRHADVVAAGIAQALPEWPRLVEDLFRALTTVSAEGHALRRPQTLARLAEVSGAPVGVVLKALDLLRADGVSFLTPRPDKELAPEDWIDVGHEALIRGWQALAEPLDGWLVREFRNGLVWRSMLVQAESFERDPANVLSEATTEERTVWMQRRTPAWAERYGGGWARVQALLLASVNARDEQAAERARHRKAETERVWQARRLKKNTLLGVLATVVFGGLAVVGFGLRQEAEAGRQAAMQAQRLAEQRAAQLEAAATRSRQYYEQTVSNFNKVETAQGQLDKALQSRSDTELRQAVAAAARQISGAANGLQQTAADLAPRLYVHIANESQRPAAVAFGKQLEQLRLGTMRIFVPGVQRVEKQAGTGVLRCFRVDECRDDAPRLLALANGLLAAPTLQLQNLSSQYESSKSLRPLHFELWFGPVDVVLKRP